MKQKKYHEVYLSVAEVVIVLKIYLSLSYILQF